MKEFVYNISHPGEKCAGIQPYEDQVKISVAYDPGGDEVGPDSFQEIMLQHLIDWYDGATVTLLSDDDQDLYRGGPG
jgi:hypothetical protein